MASGAGDSSLPMSYYILFAAAELLALLSVILVGILFGDKINPGGYNWKTTPFSYHPLMMTLGLLFFYANGILLYRTLAQTKKLIVKLLHALFLILAFVFGLVGLAAIIESKNQAKRSHFMSFHAWLGILTLSFFFFQWIGGFVAFLVPQLSLQVRQRYMPNHRFFGKIIFLSVVLSIISGLSEYGASSAFFIANDAQQTRRLLLIFFGLSTSGLAGIVVYLLSNVDYQRAPEREL